MAETLAGKARRMRGLAKAAGSPAARFRYLERAAIFEAQAGGLLVAVPVGRSGASAASAMIWAWSEIPE